MAIHYMLCYYYIIMKGADKLCFAVRSQKTIDISEVSHEVPVLRI